MLKLEELKSILKASLPLKRYKHSIAVYETALELASVHKLDVQKVAVAALLHDCGREIPSRDSLAKAAELGIEVDRVEANQPILLHAKLGVFYARKKYGIEDQEILDGILYHTTGAPHMTPLAMAVYLADLLEPTRDFPGIAPLKDTIGGRWLWQNKKMFQDLKPFMEEIHKTGAKLFVQLTAGMGRSWAITDHLVMLH
ncbi:MAG: bis(5'-nucleosyl)-tetraphosphatase (symmetrical) YqeK, partial [Phascolarctobacterium sp.]|nr:bis(5'-nucleosyl)-tetraphosphatase (symmetrical) YqeK [Phascolarctobacterium sp.]